MKIILLSLLVLTGAFAKAQHQSSQATQVITMRLQPVSLIDFNTAEKTNPTTPKEAPASALHEIIINKNTLQTAAIPAASVKKEAHHSSIANSYAFNDTEPVYTFSSR